MKRGIFKKSKILFGSLVLLSSLTFATSCSAFFGGDEYAIANVSQTTDETTGDTVVTIEFQDEKINPLTFTIPAAGLDGTGIANISATTNDGVVTLTISYTDSNKENTVISVPVIKGDKGLGIQNVIVENDAEGNMTLQFAYTDGKTSQVYTIPKGIDGKDGTGIKEITTERLTTGTTIITITFDDETLEPVTFPVNDGVSITDVTYDPENSTDLTYRVVITLSNGETRELDFPAPRIATWLSGTTIPNNEEGRAGDFYLNMITGDVYTKLTADSWSYLFCIKGTGASQEIVKHSVVFNLRDDERVENLNPGSQILVRVNEGETLLLDDIPLPTKDGFEFIGWFAGEDESNPNIGQITNLTVISNDLNLFARWRAI